MRARAGWALAALLLGGCSHTETHRVWFAGEPSGPSAGAELHLDAVPSRPFVELGLVQALGYGEDANPKAVLDALRREGTRLGCGAVVRVRQAQGATMAQAIGVCVRWEAPR